jgi:hypothetical protein
VHIEKFSLNFIYAFFQKNQLGIGPMLRIVAEIGKKLDFRAFCSEI